MFLLISKPCIFYHTIARVYEWIDINVREVAEQLPPREIYRNRHFDKLSPLHTQHTYSVLVFHLRARVRFLRYVYFLLVFYSKSSELCLR